MPRYEDNFLCSKYMTFDDSLIGQQGIMFHKIHREEDIFPYPPFCVPRCHYFL